ncbi:fumarylacetoacetate hydrolase family protein [Piscinibacter sakaiensis]|uniref:Fumarylacetoacetate hydrolase family protein n=2 Tax=Piscinibacter sakaiensis TaxID=1547922 RepID=A0A0K8NUT6_PISS1|nr:fumarylacetoacetate hydrolase family protein [Piscinibacter sakaiensis]
MRFEHGGRSGFGRLDGDAVQVFRGDMFAAPEPTGERLPRTELRPLPPCRPGQILGLWNNFHAAAQKNGWNVPAEPLYFLKSPSSLAADGAPIPVPRAHDGRVFYEGELAVVIGRLARGVSVAEGPAHIFGYTCANDVSAVELLQRDPSFPQWTRAKSFDGFCPLGPVIVPDVDLARAHVRTRVGGRERQNYPLADMIFPPAELVARLSQDITLHPGDVILCGTSLGALPMKAGSEVEVEIDGIGTLRNVYG